MKSFSERRRKETSHERHPQPNAYKHLKKVSKKMKAQQMYARTESRIVEMSALSEKVSGKRGGGAVFANLGATEAFCDVG